MVNSHGIFVDNPVMFYTFVFITNLPKIIQILHQICVHMFAGISKQNHGKFYR